MLWHDMTFRTLFPLLMWAMKMQQTKIFEPFHGVSLSDQHWNHDAHFYLSFCPCLCLCFGLCDDVCASCAPCPYPCPCLCAFYASSPSLYSRFLIFLQ